MSKLDEGEEGQLALIATVYMRVSAKTVLIHQEAGTGSFGLHGATEARLTGLPAGDACSNRVEGLLQFWHLRV